MSKIKLLTLAVVGLMIVNLAMIAFLLLRKPLQHPEGRQPMEQAGPKNIIINKLHFDKAQTAKYEVLIEQHQAKIKSLNDSIYNAKNELYSTLTNENVTGKYSVIDRLGLLQKQVELTHYDHFAVIRALCNPQQLEAFNKLTKELAGFFAPVKKMVPHQEINPDLVNDFFHFQPLINFCGRNKLCIHNNSLYYFSYLFTFNEAYEKEAHCFLRRFHHPDGCSKGWVHRSDSNCLK